MTRRVEQSFLIIGGSTRSASTSLYVYLSAHPEVCVSVPKETRFFLDPEYVFHFERRIRGELSDYLRLFPRWPSDDFLYIEVTPDYLYSPGTPSRIRDTLGDVKLVFVLREPVRRLVSWFRFAKQSGILDRNRTFPQYVTEMFQIEEPVAWPQHMRALEQARYARYLRPYFEVFGEKRVRVFFFEELVRDLPGALTEICRLGGVDPDFFRNYDFRYHNPSLTFRSQRFARWTQRVRRAAREATHGRERLAGVKDRVWRIVEPAYHRLNATTTESVEIPSEMMDTLERYYRDDRAELETLLGRTVPWTGSSRTYG